MTPPHPHTSPVPLNLLHAPSRRNKWLAPQTCVVSLSVRSVLAWFRLLWRWMSQWAPRSVPSPLPVLFCSGSLDHFSAHLRHLEAVMWRGDLQVQGPQVLGQISRLGGVLRFPWLFWSPKQMKVETCWPWHLQPPYRPRRSFNPSVCVLPSLNSHKWSSKNTFLRFSFHFKVGMLKMLSGANVCWRSNSFYQWLAVHLPCIIVQPFENHCSFLGEVSWEVSMPEPQSLGLGFKDLRSSKSSRCLKSGPSFELHQNGLKKRKKTKQLLIGKVQLVSLDLTHILMHLNRHGSVWPDTVHSSDIRLYTFYDKFPF